MDHTFDFLIQDLNLKYIHTFMKKNYWKMFYLEFHIWASKYQGGWHGVDTHFNAHFFTSPIHVLYYILFF